MINSITLNTFSTVNNKNLQANNANKQNIAFTGKNLVQMSLLGYKYPVPKAVADVRRSVISMATFKDKPDLAFSNSDITSMCNAINLKDGLFLGIAHFKDLTRPQKQLLAIGKHLKTEIDNWKWRHCPVKIHRIKTELDLALLKHEQNFKKIFGIQSRSIKIAENPPKFGEMIYIVGYHSEFKEPKAIPAMWMENCRLKIYATEMVGNKARYDEIHVPYLRDKIDTRGLSGSAVVNKKGKLVGVIGKSSLYANNNKSDGNLYMINLDTIQKFLKRHKIFPTQSI